MSCPEYSFTTFALTNNQNRFRTEKVISKTKQATGGNLEIPGFALELGAKSCFFLERGLGFVELFTEGLLEFGELVDLRLGFLDLAAVLGYLGL